MQVHMRSVMQLADTDTLLAPAMARLQQLGQTLLQQGEAPKLQYQSLESKLSVLEGSILSSGETHRKLLAMSPRLLCLPLCPMAPPFVLRR